MDLGVCSYERGCDGSSCSHQAAIVKHYNKISVNCVPVIYQARQLLATIAVGYKSSIPSEFYSSLHEKSIMQHEQEDHCD